MEKPEPAMKARTPGYITAPKVKVKVENVGTDSDNEGNEEDDDDDGDGEDDGDNDRSDEKNQAKRIYKHSLKVLKFKLYFEDFFPTDDDRGARVYDCWMAGAEATKGLDKDHTALKWMLYRFKYDKQVCEPPPSYNSSS